MIDGLISLAWFVPLGTTTTSNGSFSYSISGLPFLVAILAWIGYFTLLEGLVAATPGKLVVGIRVVKQDGSRLDLGSALVRSLMRLVDAFPYVLPYLVGAIAVWSSPSRQRLGDRVAGSIVIRAGSDHVSSGPEVPPPPPAG